MVMNLLYIWVDHWLEFNIAGGSLQIYAAYVYKINSPVQAIAIHEFRRANVYKFLS